MTDTAHHSNTTNKIIIIVIFIIIVIIIRHSVLFFLYTFVPRPSRAQSTLCDSNIHVHIFLTSTILSFCGWLVASLLLQVCGENEMFVRIVAGVVFFDLEKSGIPGRCSLGPIKQVMSQENRDEHDL